MLPLLGLLSYLKPDGTYYPNPWLLVSPDVALSPSPPQQSDSTRSQSLTQGSQQAEDAQQDTESTSQQLLAAASARLSQRSTAELASSDISSDGVTPSSKSAEANGANGPGKIAPHKGHDFQEALVQSAAALVLHSPLPKTRFQAISWVNSLMSRLSNTGCLCVGNSEAVSAAVRLIQQDSEPIESRAAAVRFCLGLHQRGFLPVGLLLEANVHKQLTAFVVQSGQRTTKTHAFLPHDCMSQYCLYLVHLSDG